MKNYKNMIALVAIMTTLSATAGSYFASVEKDFQDITDANDNRIAEEEEMEEDDRTENLVEIE